MMQTCVESVLLTLIKGRGRECTALLNGKESELDKVYFHLAKDCTGCEVEKKIVYCMYCI